MCEQCLAEAVKLGEILHGIYLVQATKDGRHMKAGDYGLVEMNDPFFIWSYPPSRDPLDGLTDAQINALTMDSPETLASCDWLTIAGGFHDQFEIEPRLAWRLVEKMRREGYKPEVDETPAHWLFNRMGHLLQIKKTPTGDKGIHTGRPRYRVTCTACKMVLHENTTGPGVRSTDHLSGRNGGYARPLRDGEEP